MSDSFEAIESEITSEFNPDKVTKQSTDETTFICNHATYRLDHYMCGDEDCECYESEGWCEEQWREECEAPLLKSVDEWVKKTFSDETLEKYSIKPSVCEKGGLYITLSLMEAASKKDGEEKEPEKKRLKV